MKNRIWEEVFHKRGNIYYDILQRDESGVRWYNLLDNIGVIIFKNEVMNEDLKEGNMRKKTLWETRNSM